MQRQEVGCLTDTHCSGPFCAGQQVQHSPQMLALLGSEALAGLVVPPVGKVPSGLGCRLGSAGLQQLLHLGLPAVVQVGQVSYRITHHHHTVTDGGHRSNASGQLSQGLLRRHGGLL